VRYIGREPMKVAEFEQALSMIKDFMNGRTVSWNDRELELKLGAPGAARDPDVRRGLRAEGARRRRPRRRRKRDHPARRSRIISWIMDTARRAAEEAGRDPSQLSASSARRSPSPTTSPTREQVRWFRRWSRTTSWI
jgi:hypothetical protein